MKIPVTDLIHADGEIKRAAPALPLTANSENHKFSAAHRIANVASAYISAITENVRRSWKYVFRLVSREHFFALIDQAIVSATGFLTTFLIARWAGSTQLGIYALGLSLLLTVLGFQDSLILQPYQIQRYYPGGTSAERAGASLTLSILFSAGSLLILIVAALGLLAWRASSETIVMAWAIAGIVPFALTRDFARRFGFAHLKTARVLLLDLAAAIIQLSILGWLGASGRMSATSAYAALCGACAFPTIIWLYYARAEFAVRPQHVRIALKQTWALGKWLLVGRTTSQMQGYVTYWLAAAIGGAAVTGAYAACMSIVGFANPLMIGLTNVMKPKLVLAWKHGGGPGLWRETIRNTALIAALMMAFSLAVLLAAEQVMGFLYHGKEFDGHGQTLVVLALAMSAGTLGTAASIALATMKRPRAIIAITTIGAALTVPLVWVLMTKWGLLGAAYGMLAGNVTGAVGRWMAFYVIVPKVCDLAPVERVLQEFTKCVDNSRWTVTRLNGNEDAEVFAINSTGRQPIWSKYSAVVVKLIKLEAASPFEIMQAQTDLHTALDDREINGWRISVPRPLYVCKSPPALVVTEVPGQPIGSYTSRSDALTSQILLDAARTFAMAIEQYWSSGRRHGDLNFGNVLFDLEAKKISFIDAGTPADCRICSNITKFQSAPVCDLSHLLWEVAHDVTDLVEDLVRSQTARMSNEMFAETILCTIVDRIDSREEKRRLLNDIWICAQQHLDDKLDLPWSFRGASNRSAKQIVKKVAKRRIASILARVEAHINIFVKESGQSESRMRRAAQSIMSQKC
jgi:O-antigen/teichoic acid export membrane protein